MCNSRKKFVTFWNDSCGDLIAANSHTSSKEMNNACPRSKHSPQRVLTSRERIPFFRTGRPDRRTSSVHTR